MHSVFPVTLSLFVLFFLLLCLFFFFVFPYSVFPVTFFYVTLSFFLFCLYVILSFLCYSVSFHVFVALPLPLFSSSFWLHFYPFTCLFFDIFAWIFKYIKILLSFYFFVCLFTLFLFLLFIYVSESLWKWVIM